MSTLEQVLETALQLPYEQQEMLIKICKIVITRVVAQKLLKMLTRLWHISAQSNFSTNRPEKLLRLCANPYTNQKHESTGFNLII